MESSRLQSSTLEARVAYVALGSNLGNSREILLQAMHKLQELSAHDIRRSSLWKTAPVDCPPGSLPFINAMIGLRPLANETPESLLSKLQQLEKEFGRQPKTVLNEPRVLDLDLISFGNEQRETDQLVLPHSRAHARAFVLRPLFEIAPTLVLPGQGRTVEQLVNALPPGDGVERLD